MFISNKKYEGSLLGCLIDKTLLPDANELTKFVERKGYEIGTLDDNAWSVTNKDKYLTRKKILSKGLSLKDLNYSISNGFRTGFNEAYIINEETKNELIQKEPKSKEIIKQIIRGRDVKKYNAVFDNQYVIIIAHGEGELLNTKYPIICEYLNKFEKELKARGQVKNGQHHWLELDNHPSKEYLALFEKDKIIYPEITKFLPFFLDNSEHYYSNNKTFFINGENLETSVAFLNSSLFKYAFKEEFPELQGNSRELRKVFMENIPFVKADSVLNEKFKNLVHKIILAIDDEKSVILLENEINELVYQLYELTEEEIKVVEGSVK